MIGARGGEKSVPRVIHSSETSVGSPTSPNSAVQPWSMDTTVMIRRKPSSSAEIGTRSLAHKIDMKPANKNTFVVYL